MSFPSMWSTNFQRICIFLTDYKKHQDLKLTQLLIIYKPGSTQWWEAKAKTSAVQKVFYMQISVTCSRWQTIKCGVVIYVLKSIARLRQSCRATYQGVLPKMLPYLSFTAVNVADSLERALENNCKPASH